MTSAPQGQYRIDMPDGLVIERLPLGYANGQWRLAFVTSGAATIWRLWTDPQHRSTGSEAFRDRINVEGLGGALDLRGAGSGGSAEEQEYAMSFRCDEDTTGIKVTYRHDGEVVGDEDIALPGSPQTD
jgi:hypothetical protein